MELTWVFITGPSPASFLQYPSFAICEVFMVPRRLGYFYEHQCKPFNLLEKKKPQTTQRRIPVTSSTVRHKDCTEELSLIAIVGGWETVQKYHDVKVGLRLINPTDQVTISSAVEEGQPSCHGER